VVDLLSEISRCRIGDLQRPVSRAMQFRFD